MASRRKNPRETSDRLSSLASTILRSLPANSWVTYVARDGNVTSLRSNDLRALCGCVLGQDQTKGKRAVKA